MADQKSRGGKKQPTQDPGTQQKHQTVGAKPERPAAGQPGGPKEHTGAPRKEHHKK